MRKMFQYRIYPNKKQVKALEAPLEECRWLSIHLVEKRRDAWEQEGRSLSLYQQQETFGVLKQERPTLKHVHSHVNRMVHNHCLAKSISDVAWSAFFDQLAAKAEEAGRELIKVNPAYTSQTCSCCGHRQKMPRAARTDHCPCCLLVIDRDLNAARTILALGLQCRVIPEAPA